MNRHLTSQREVIKKNNSLGISMHSGVSTTICMGLIFSSSLKAQESSNTQESVLLPEVSLIGSDASQQVLPASGVFIGKDDLKKQNYVDVNRVLRQVPGVYVREEDGSGLFPNISVRGVTTERSKAVTVMEDGIKVEKYFDDIRFPGEVGQEFSNELKAAILNAYNNASDPLSPKQNQA